MQINQIPTRRIPVRQIPPRRQLLIASLSLLIAGCGIETEPVVIYQASDTAAPAEQAATTPVEKASVESAPVKAVPVTEAPRPLSDEELAAGWISLFDGETLFGWEPETDANWRVEAGAIVVDDGPRGLLTTTTGFADYVLKVDFRSAAGTNSGIFLHTPPTPKDPSSDCYELNIADSDNPFPTGSLVKRAKAQGNFDSQDWQSYEVTVAGDRVVVW